MRDGTGPQSSLFDALAEWFDGFVGSDEERAVADALLHVVIAAERVATADEYPNHLRGTGDLAVWMNGVAGASLGTLKGVLGV